jgi:hypothetical protein
LGRWQEWGSNDAVKEYVIKILGTKDGLFDFLNGFVSESISQSIEDLVPKKTTVLNKKIIEHFIDLHEIEKRIEEIDESELDLEQAKLIELYRKEVKDIFEEE